MIRFVLGPDRVVVPDLACRLPGRGLWLTSDPDVLSLPRLGTAFAKAARGPVTVPADLGERVQIGLARRIGELVGLARRAGQAVGGFRKAREWLVRGRAGLLIQACDASFAERLRLAALGRVPIATPLSSAALGSLFGRDHLTHVVVARGRLARTIEADWGRLAALRGQAAGLDPDSDASGLSGGEELASGAAGRVDEGKRGRVNGRK